ncbi:MAG: hypothetical protein HC908_17355 [Calothrix sp. SM1_7_51]|nr:hypothetical protein [Calothrix sp. SM1_7_51]
MDLLIREARIDDAEAIVTMFNPIIEAGAYTAITSLSENPIQRSLVACC